MEEMKGKVWKFAVVILVMTVFTYTFWFIVPSIGVGIENEVDVQITSRTEYVAGDEGQVITEVRYVLSGESAPATCYASAYYPNKTALFSNELMTNQSFGTHYYEFVVPSDEGVYEYQTVCDIGILNVTRSKAFHVSGAHRETLEAIAARIDIVPQGVSQVELSKTAAQSWLFNTDDWINVDDAFCSVYRLLDNNREFVVGSIYDETFTENNTLDEWNITQGLNTDYLVMTPSSVALCGSASVYCIRGDPVIDNGQMRLVWQGSSLNDYWAIKKVNFTGDWEISFTWQNEQSTATSQQFNFVLLKRDDLNGSLGQYVNLNPFHETPANAMIGFGYNILLGSGSRGWAVASPGFTATDPGATGNLYVLQNQPYVNTTARWVRTNATRVAIGPATTSLVKSGTTYSFFYDGILQYEWEDVLDEDPVAILFGGNIDNPGYEWLVDNIEIKTSVSDEYEFGAGSKLFTYYWFTDPQIVQRGESYVIDCDVVVEQSDGLKSLQDLVQYVYINRAGRIRAVSVK